MNDSKFGKEWYAFILVGAIVSLSLLSSSLLPPLLMTSGVLLLLKSKESRYSVNSLANARRRLGLGLTQRRAKHADGGKSAILLRRLRSSESMPASVYASV